NLGLLFSRNGITGGQGGDRDASREIVKVLHDSGTIILCVTQQDIQSIADGDNFITLLRERYEKVRLDLKQRKHQSRQPRENLSAGKSSLMPSLDQDSKIS